MLKLVSEVRSFYGLTGSYIWFIKYFSSLALLDELVKKDVKFIWTILLKDKFCHVRILALSSFDTSFELECDSSGIQIGAVLMQEGLPIIYFSEKLNEVPLNYSTYDTELYVLVRDLELWRSF